ncbi:hypothetical protein WN943_013282 [Citrus x changshan-huyou]
MQQKYNKAMGTFSGKCFSIQQIMEAELAQITIHKVSQIKVAVADQQLIEYRNRYYSQDKLKYTKQRFGCPYSASSTKK